MSALVKLIDHYILQLSPHIAARESARLLTESRDLLEKYESMLKRLGDPKDFPDVYQGDDPVLYRESCEDARIKYAQEALK